MLHAIPLRLITLRVKTPASLRAATGILLLFAVITAAHFANSQEPISPKAPTSSAKVPVARKRSPAKPAASNPQNTTADAPAAPPTPVWPANKAPTQAHITWDSQGLKIEAANSSLDQVLKEISTITGAKIEGFSKDQRIFGTYGPGPAREVLSGLLDGSGYNVLMVGGVGNAPPREVILSTAGPAGPAPPPGAQPQQNDNDVDVEADNPQMPEPPPMPQQEPPQETPQPTPIRNPFGMPSPEPMQQPPMQQPQPMPPDQQNQQNGPPQ